MSEPVPTPSRLAPERERLRPEDVVHPGGQAEVRPRVMHRERQAHAHPADVVDDLLEAGEVELDEMVDVDAGNRLDGLPGAGRPAEVQGRVDQLELAGGPGLLARGAVAGRAPQDRHHGLPRDAHHGGLVMTGRDVQQHQGVGTLPRDAIAANLGVPVDAGVGANQQNVLCVVVLWRLLAEQAHHVDALDAVPDAAVLDISAERADDQDRGEANRDPRGDPPAERMPRALPGLRQTSPTPWRVPVPVVHIGASPHRSSGPESSGGHRGTLAATVLRPMLRVRKVRFRM